MARAGERIRKTPLQARSKERMERILEAAVLEFADPGYEAATVEAIAARAETSIGSVYQFFPNKKAIFDAVAERCTEQVRSLLEVAVSEDVLAQPWPVVLAQVIDLLWAYSLEAPAFRAVWITGNLSQELLATGEALNEELAELAEALIGRYGPQLTKKRRAMVATVVVETISCMVFVAGRRGGAISTALREETKTLVGRYLEAELRQATPAARPRARRRAT